MIGFLKKVFGGFWGWEKTHQQNNQERYLARMKFIATAWVTKFIVVVVFIPWLLYFFTTVLGLDATAAKVTLAIEGTQSWPPHYIEWLDWTVKACLGIVTFSHVGGHVSDIAGKIIDGIKKNKENTND